ncbi:MAG: MarR family transcriptional regulator [Acidimicrobiales bacterium]|nr:MarR family transcriptional regulator [Acidimicrobiales bacterium]
MAERTESNAGNGDHAGRGPGTWTFLTNHGHVLIVLYRNPELRQRDIAALVGITEGAVQRILTDLQACGYVATERVGRRNRYAVDGSLGLRHPLEHGHCVGELLERLGSDEPAFAVASSATKDSQ